MIESIFLSGADQSLSRIGFGGCPIGGHGWGTVDDRESVAAIRRAVELGVNFFDTADVYGLGHSEEVLASSLGPMRHDVVIATKFGVRWDSTRRTWKDTSPKYLRSAIEESLRRLKLSCIPLYYVHWPDGVTPIQETMAELVRCRQEGKLRWIGLSNFSSVEVQQAMTIGKVNAVQVSMNILERDIAEELLPLIRKTGTTLVTWGSLAQGLLTGKFNAHSQFSESDRRHRYDNFCGEQFQENIKRVEVIKRIAEEVGRTPAQVAIRWLLDTHGVGIALSGAKRPAQIEENLGALGWQLEDADYQALNHILTSGTEVLQGNNLR
jgi:myo-inositol catabolism protein IolS